MIEIIDKALYVNGAEVQTLPTLPFDATVRVWAVPTNYMPSGYYVDVWMDGTTKSEPASAQQDTTYIGSARYPHDEDARTAYEVEQGKVSLLNAATDKRWNVMTGGMVLPNGIEVGTTIDDQNRITSVVANAALAGLTDADEVDFKAASGWVRVSIAEVKAIAGSIGQFVQACYSAERAHHEDIEKLKTREQIRDYDINIGWPA